MPDLTRSPWPISANPGGPIDPEDHIGHEAELHEVLRSIASVGALLPGDRRMGKTSLLRKAEQQLVEHVVLRVSAETDDLDLFGRRLLEVLRGNRVFADELKRWKVEIDVGYRGFRLTRRARDGPDRDEVTDDLFAWAAARVGTRKLVVVIDEITVLAAAIEQQRPGGAAEFLRSLRRPRQELPNVAVILSGSVGLHHAVADMAPLNDLRKVRVGPLAADDAAFLARCLLLGEQIETDDEPDVVQTMVAEAEAIPYFLHHLAAQAGGQGGPLTVDGVRSMREAALTDPDDRWNLSHYQDRIPAYYGCDTELVLHILDAYAAAGVPLAIDELASSVASVGLEHPPARAELVRLVENLEADHYLVRRGNADEFAFRIVRDTWRSRRHR